MQTQSPPISNTSLDEVFEALALLAGTLEARRALRRFSTLTSDHSENHQQKKRSHTLVVRNVNIISEDVDPVIGGKKHG